MVAVAMASNTGEEQYRVRMRSNGSKGNKVAAPEKQLNIFVHVVAMTERVGNALGTLAFTWATVVLLGGYPTVLRPDDDFWFATIIVFLEATRMFSRENRPDYQLFFSTRGAFRRLGWNGLLTVMVYFSTVLVILSNYYFVRGGSVLVLLVVMVMLVAISQMLSPRALKLLSNPLRHAISLWSPLLAIILLGPCIPQPAYDFESQEVIFKNSKTRWVLYIVLFLFVLLPTISRLRFPCIIKLVDSVLSRKQLAWHQVILNFGMFAAIVMLVFTFDGFSDRIIIMVYQVYAFLVVSFGNFQVPAAVVRVVLALQRLVPQNYAADGVNAEQDAMQNLKPSLNIFYGMVIGQGILYIVACVLEVFSFIPKRSLIIRGGFKGQLGVKYANLYYAYAFETSMGGPVLAPKKISLITFAMDSLNSDSTKNKLYGVQMMTSLLKKEHLRTKTIAKLTSSTKTVASLFNMLGWTCDGDADVRLFAAKVTAEIAGSLRVAAIPGAMQMVASLLDIDHQLKIRDHFLFIHSQEVKDLLNNHVGMDEQNSPVLNYWKQMVINCLIPVDEPCNKDELNLRIVRCWKQITKFWSIPEEEPSTDQDFLPVQGLLILERLANFDTGNRMEISRATGLISKMIDFTSYRNYMTSINEAHKILLAGLSLRVLRTLAGTKGNLGITLRQQILEYPLLLRNLAEILDDSGSCYDLRELAAEIIKNLAMDRNTSEDIGHFQVIISGLMRAFLSQDSDHLLREITGQALAMLAMESTNNCLVMLMEPGFMFMKELTTMIHDDKYKYTAVSLLGSMCEHARSELSNSDLEELSYTLREVLKGIMDSEGAELEVLISLSSQICKVVPDDFARELEHSQIKKKYVKRLVSALNSHRRPSADCPGIRRVIVQHAIYLMEFDSRYTNDFHNCWMVEGLSVVEKTSSRLENYRLFSGDIGLMEHSTPLSTLVARAKELMAREWVRGIGTAI